MGLYRSNIVSALEEYPLTSLTLIGKGRTADKSILYRDKRDFTNISTLKIKNMFLGTNVVKITLVIQSTNYVDLITQTYTADVSDVSIDVSAIAGNNFIQFFVEGSNTTDDLRMDTEYELY